MSLTMKQEQACRAYIVNGGDKSAAYRSAYNATNMKQETINNKAYQLFKRDDIRARLAEILKPSDEAFEVYVERKKRWLVKVIERGLQPEPVLDKEGSPTGIYKFQANAVIRAIAELNRMSGHYKPHQIDVNIGFEAQLKKLMMENE